MFTTDAFKKVTGVDLNADATALVKGLAKVVKATTENEIRTALIVRTLVVEHSWKVSESAHEVGLSSSAASVAGKRGKVLWETGPESLAVVWQALRSIPSKTLEDLATHLQTMTTEADRTDYVVRLGVSSTVTTRLGEATTPERVAALTDTLLAEGHRTPVAAKAAVAGIAKRLEIALPVVKRPGTPASKVEGKADVPTFDAAMTAALAAIRQAMEGADDDNPVMLTPAQSALADDVMQALAALVDVAKVAVPA